MVARSRHFAGDYSAGDGKSKRPSWSTSSSRGAALTVDAWGSAMAGRAIDPSGRIPVCSRPDRL